MHTHTHAHTFPIYKVENDCILSKRGDISIAFKSTLPEIFTLSDKEYESFHQILVKAIKVLPSNTIFHKQDWFVSKRNVADFQYELPFLSHCSERFFNERPFLDHHCNIILTRKASTTAVNSYASSLLRGDLVVKDVLSPIWLQEFLDATSQFQQILSDSGFMKLSRLSGEDLIGTTRNVGLIEKYWSLNDSDLPIVRDIQFKDELTVGDQRCQIFALSDVEDLPSLCGARINYDRFSTDRTKFSVGFASPLGHLLSCNHIFNQYIFVEDAQKTIKALESKRLRLQSLSTYSRENAIARDATNEFLNEAISAQRLPVKAHFNVLVWTTDKQELKEVRTKVSSAMAQMDAVARQEIHGAPQLFWSAIPGNESDFPINDAFDTFLEQATCFLNLEGAYQSSLSPIGIRLGDRLTGKPIHVDISDEPMHRGICTNRNKIIIGPSGSGKSFFTNHMVRSYYEQGTHIVLVDVGHSYKGLCSAVNGYYFTYSESHPIRFNPFFISEGDTLDTEKKESIKTLLLALWKKGDESFNRSEYVALSISLQGYYAHLQQSKDIIPCFNTYYEYLRDVFIDVLKADKVKDKDFDVENFLYVLRPYYRGGEFDYLLNATENLDLLRERFIVFELDNIKDHPILFPVVTIIIMEVFISKMRKLKGVRKMILIEEAWKAIAREGMAEYIKYLFKTVRKFFGEAIVVTQEVEDIISSTVVKQAIINNSDCKILLDQSKYQNKFDAIQELLGLSDKEKAMILSMNKSNDPSRKYKEVFISLGGMLSRVYATEVSLEEYLIYTTEESEKVKVEQYAARYGSIQKGIQALANEIRNAKPSKA
ncbi:TraG family conjugative transposon ATPase [Pseudochryseolinea flava]|uniref:Conjugal transfer protein TraG n=1 Tax=Pseudochryseolinea flava TaxID=2059302 RepID=A0A364XWT8_9BACT|nr:TraG family conjugative transposon ATPase [Pseudochryseolinea flava]RAV98850.1 conjugal transfer protein TraG [Pseudochryseolinea flava]